MTHDVEIRRYSAADHAACLALFDANCPEYFAPNERAEYQDFLGDGGDYRVCVREARVVGAYGLAPHAEGGTAIRWILLDPVVHGAGIGRAIMTGVLEELRTSGRMPLHISASHMSAPFFARFGAQTLSTVPDGWGPGMHRVEMEIRG